MQELENVLIQEFSYDNQKLSVLVDTGLQMQI